MFRYFKGICVFVCVLFLLAGCGDDGTSTTLIGPKGVVTTLAGTAGVRGSTDGVGAAARFDAPYGITSDGTNLYVADRMNSTIRKIEIATGVVTTFAGTFAVFGLTDGTGSAASFSFPAGITSDGTNLYVADQSNCAIRKLVIATGVVTTLAGSGVWGSTDGTGSAASFNGPVGITSGGPNLYVTDYINHTIRKIVIATGVVTTLAGTAGVYGSTDGTGADASFYYPTGITSDSTNLYVTDNLNHTIRKIVIATGDVTTLAGTAGVHGSIDGTGAVASFYHPAGITSDGTNLYVADQFNSTIRKIVIANGVVATLAGTAGVWGSIDGTGTSASFNGPVGITSVGSNLYVTDYGSHTVRWIQ